MTLYHYSATPFVLDRTRTYTQTRDDFKPKGLWLSAEAGTNDDWDGSSGVRVRTLTQQGCRIAPRLCCTTMRTFYESRTWRQSMRSHVNTSACIKTLTGTASAPGTTEFSLRRIFPHVVSTCRGITRGTARPRVSGIAACAWSPNPDKKSHPSSPAHGILTYDDNL